MENLLNMYIFLKSIILKVPFLFILAWLVPMKVIKVKEVTQGGRHIKQPSRPFQYYENSYPRGVTGLKLIKVTVQSLLEASHPVFLLSVLDRYFSSG